jgi:Lon protease-like protein
MTDSLNINNLLTCQVCGDLFTDPITLSCGNTICSRCFPIACANNDTSLFICPIPNCKSSSHLFGRELLVDNTISQLVQCVSNATPENEKLNQVVSLLRCNSCHNIAQDAITTHCGHTFCRLCILKCKIETDSCSHCTRPLPKFSQLSAQSPNHIISCIISKLNHYSQETDLLNSHSLSQYQAPLFVSGNVILPGQHTRIPIFTESALHMFSGAIIPSSRYNGLCLAAVHRSQPKVAQFGTILKITNIERCPDAIMVNVIAMDRFKLETHDQVSDSRILADFDILCESHISQLGIEFPCNSNAELSMMNEHAYGYAVELAEAVLHFIHHLGESSPMPSHVLHSQTTGVLGPMWYKNIQANYGPMPSSDDPVAVCWWAANALPTSSNDLYSLLRTVPIVDRLELVLSWMQAMQTQWQRCRNTAMEAINRATL